jgi:PII-like signaling protein
VIVMKNPVTPPLTGTGHSVAVVGPAHAVTPLSRSALTHRVRSVLNRWAHRSADSQGDEPAGDHEKETAMKLAGNALRVMIFIDDDDVWHHKPLYTEIVHRAHAAGLAGASVFHGVEGFGASSMVHTTRLLNLSEDLPMMIVIVDVPERIRAFLPQLDELIDEGLVTIDEVLTTRYSRDGNNPGRRFTAEGVG